MIRVKKFLCLIASYEWQLYAVKQLATVIYLDQGPLLSDDGMLVRNFSDDKIKSWNLCQRRLAFGKAWTGTRCESKLQTCRGQGLVLSIPGYCQDPWVLLWSCGILKVTKRDLFMVKWNHCSWKTYPPINLSRERKKYVTGIKSHYCRICNLVLACWCILALCSRTNQGLACPSS